MPVRQEEIFLDIWQIKTLLKNLKDNEQNRFGNWNRIDEVSNLLKK